MLKNSSTEWDFRKILKTQTSMKP